MKELKCPQCGHVFHVDREMFESIASQVRNIAFNEELDRRIAALRAQMQAEARAERLKDEKAWQERLTRTQQSVTDRDARIKVLNERLDNITQTKNAERQLALLTQQQESAAEIAELKNRVKAMSEQHALEMRQKDETIEYYKDLKARMSTKMIGETLEIHCHTMFEQARSMGMFPDAEFGKDNDASLGTKGDFIFRDFTSDGTEYISIMFEMKNEADTTATKHKNTDFLDKLDKDRRDKGCEYAVLVSMLERDNPLYDNGIVDLSHRYPKMYVIRPQLFMTLIALLCRAARKNLHEIETLRAELAVAREQSIDVTKFEQRRDQFVDAFGKLVAAHTRKHDEAVSGIDKVIESLEKQIENLRKVKNAFEVSEQKLVKAGEKVETDFTIKKLTHGNPTMRAKFDEARRQNDND
ncbi:MAG: DUF2130 domain-containing protein [Bacteroidales bacterium]|nr:DUF2130 domain-containing protein [Bacteroidales bacterium]